MVKDEQKPSVIRSAAAMSLGTIFSRLLGYVRDAIILARFSSTVTDAYFTAFRLPNLARRLLGEGSLSISFIPVYVDQLVKEEKGVRARQLANATYTLLCSLTMTLSILLWLFMRPLIVLWVGNEAGYAAVPGKIELTIALARIMAIYMVLVTTYAFWMAMANALQRFFIPALAPAVFNLCAILFSLLPDHPEIPGAYLAWGVVAGGVVQAVMVAVSLYRLGHFPRLTLQVRVPGLKTVLTNMGPGLIGLGIYQVMTVANTFFAARLPEGTQSYLYTADRILEFPQSMIAVSLGTALLPTFSRQLSQGNRPAMLTTANETLRAMLFLALPSAVGMWVLSHPIIEVLFLRGAFGPEDVRVTASIVEVYAILLVFSSLTKVTVPAFYALKNTWLPATIAGLSLCLHLFLASWWVDRFGVDGLASATAVSGALNMLALQIAFRVMIGPVRIAALMRAMLRMFPALALMGIQVHYSFPWFQQLFTPVLGDILGRAIALLGTIGLAVPLYLGLSSLCGSEEATRTLEVLRRRFLRNRAG